MSSEPRRCPDCDPLLGFPTARDMSRRDFIKTAAASAVAVGAVPGLAYAADKAAKKQSQPESLVKTLYETFNDKQKAEVCFDWNYMDPERGLLRTRISNNWHITKPAIGSDFFTKDQQAIIRDIFEGIISPEWHKRLDRQLTDDAGGYGKSQNIAIFGTPGDGKYELVMTGRHLTIRCDGDSEDHVAFGGPIFYGHAADGFNEGPEHKGNVYWPHAKMANEIYTMLDGKQRKAALVAKRPTEQAVSFRGTSAGFPGIPITELSSDQKEHAQAVLKAMLSHYRQSDRREAMRCLNAQGGLDACSLAFYKDGDIGEDGVWDCWRIEGPSFVWYFRGEPHVHVWVNVADSPDVKLNA